MANRRIDLRECIVNLNKFKVANPNIRMTAMEVRSVIKEIGLPINSYFHKAFVESTVLIKDGQYYRWRNSEPVLLALLQVIYNKSNAIRQEYMESVKTPVVSEEEQRIQEAIKLLQSTGKYLIYQKL